MQTVVIACSLSLALLYLSQSDAPLSTDRIEIGHHASDARQLGAVRGEITRMTAAAAKGMLLITVHPPKEFQEVTVLARENDLVGVATGRSGEADLLGLFSADTRDDETITAAELNQGDIVSVIYDPNRQNRAIEIYLH
jgi:hypothetical protein